MLGKYPCLPWLAQGVGYSILKLLRLMVISSFLLFLLQNKAVYISDDCPAELSLSDDFDPEYSDFEDPAHDQEILDLLFYKNSTKSNKQVSIEHI